MGPVSRLSERQTDSYQVWRERLEKSSAKKEKIQRADVREQETQGVKGDGDEKEGGSLKETKNALLRRTRDEYVPDADRTAQADKIPEKSKGPDKASKQAEGKKPELCKASTDEVDREIEKLKKRKKEIEGQLRTEQDETKIQSLERELGQVERELSQKDNDAYRRQHTVVTKM